MIVLPICIILFHPSPHSVCESTIKYKDKQNDKEMSPVIIGLFFLCFPAHSAASTENSAQSVENIQNKEKCHKIAAKNNETFIIQNRFIRKSL